MRFGEQQEIFSLFEDSCGSENGHQIGIRESPVWLETRNVMT